MMKDKMKVTKIAIAFVTLLSVSTPSFGQWGGLVKLFTKAESKVIALETKVATKEAIAVEKAAVKATKNEEKTYQVYKMHNSETGQDYYGRTSGTGTPDENLAKRYSGASKKRDGFSEPELLLSTKNKDAARGAEDVFIRENGGVNSDKLANKRNGVALSNPNREAYIEAAKKELGKVDANIVPFGKPVSIPKDKL